MALLGDFSASSGYTRTGENIFTRVSNWLSLVPPFFTPFSWPLVTVFGAVGAMWEAAGWLLRGNIGSALTALGAGAANTAVNTLAGSNSTVYWANLGSAVFTGRTAGGHVRALTEGATSAITSPLGMQPTVLRSYTAGMGYMNDYSRPGMFAQSEMSRRGVGDMQAYHAQKLSGEAGAYVPAGPTYQAR